MQQQNNKKYKCDPIAWTFPGYQFLGLCLYCFDCVFFVGFLLGFGVSGLLLVVLFDLVLVDYCSRIISSSASILLILVRGLCLSLRRCICRVGTRFHSSVFRGRC